MSTLNTPSAIPLATTPFIELTLSIMGLGAILAWLVIVNAALPAYGITMIVASVPVTMAIRRTLLYLTSIRHQQGVISRVGFSPSDHQWLMACLAVGAALGILLLASSIFLLGVVSSILCFIPWSKIPRFRHDPISSCLVVWFATALVFALARQTPAPIFLPVAAWMFWVISLALMLRRTLEAWPIGRRSRVVTKGREAADIRG